MQQSHRNHLLDVLRGIAALLVCVSHLRAATLVDWSSVQNVNALNKALYFTTGLGHQAVMVFFVISGYLVGGSALRRSFSWGDYVGARLSRLWTVLIPCLALTAVLDAVVANIDPAVLAGGYAGRWHSTPQAGAYDNSALTLLGNVIFLQTISVPVFGSNGPLWSLANEFWYYALFPLLLLVAGRLEGSLPSRWTATALAAGALMWLPKTLLFGFLIWLLGAAVHVLQSRTSIRRGWLPAVIAGATLVATIASAKSAPNQWLGDLVVGLATALLVLVAPTSFLANRGKRAIEHLSDISFSLYLSHFPLVLLVGALAAGAVNTQPTFAAWVLLAVALALLLVAAHAMWWVFERHTPSVRRSLKRLIAAAGAARGRKQTT